jgi:hypothetical protein
VRFIERLNMPTTVVVVLVFFVVVDGFLLYHYQQSLRSPANVGANAPVEDTVTTTGTTTSESTARRTEAAVGTTTSENREERAEATAEFAHIAAPQNSVYNSTYLEDPLTLGNPDAILLAKWVSGPGGDAAANRSIGVWYDANRGDRWAVFNQDLAPMPEGTTFDVRVWEEPGEDVFVHRATSENTAGNETYVDHPSLDENPDVVFSFTPNWNPGGGAGTYVNAPVDTRYDAGEEKWVILREDLAPMPEGAAFNVVVTEDSATG